jgi:hypothetical protein
MRTLAFVLVGGVLGLMAAPGLAVGEPAGRVVADAGTGLAVVRVLPAERQPAVEVGFGLASARANSEAAVDFERAVAQTAPGGVNVQGRNPQTPGALTQTAPPNNDKPSTTGFSLPSTPLNSLVNGGVLNGSAHARWSDTTGPCVPTIADASTEVASLSVLNAIPSLPNATDLTGRFDAPNLDGATDRAIIDGLAKLAGPLRTLGGVLGNASLLSLPNTMSVRSTVALVDIPGSANKAVRSTSTMQVAAIKLLAGTPFEISINVVSRPTLQATSTGDQQTSGVTYTAPVLDVVQGGRSLGRLDTTNPTLDIPIGIPLPGVPGSGNLPIIGDLLASGQQLADALGQGLRKLDLGVIRLSIAQFNQQSQRLTQPFAGFQVGATARMLDLQILPTAALGLPNLPSALAQVSLGEQVARAFAPTGGVVCAPPQQQPSPPPPPAPMKLALTSGVQYATIPLLWVATAMLLAGAIAVAAFPRRWEPVEQTPTE